MLETAVNTSLKINKRFTVPSNGSYIPMVSHLWNPLRTYKRSGLRKEIDNLYKIEKIVQKN